MMSYTQYSKISHGFEGSETTQLHRGIWEHYTSVIASAVLRQVILPHHLEPCHLDNTEQHFEQMFYSNVVLALKSFCNSSYGFQNPWVSLPVEIFGAGRGHKFPDCIAASLSFGVKHGFVTLGLFGGVILQLALLGASAVEKMLTLKCDAKWMTFLET